MLVETATSMAQEQHWNGSLPSHDEAGEQERRATLALRKGDGADASAPGVPPRPPSSTSPGHDPLPAAASQPPVAVASLSVSIGGGGNEDEGGDVARAEKRPPSANGGGGSDAGGAAAAASAASDDTAGSGGGGGHAPLVRERSFWECQGTSQHAEEEDGGGDSSDTLGAESDMEDREREEEEMAAVLAAAVAEGGASSPSPLASGPGSASASAVGFPFAGPEAVVELSSVPLPPGSPPPAVPPAGLGYGFSVAAAAANAVATASTGSAASGISRSSSSSSATGVPPTVPVSICSSGGAMGGSGSGSGSTGAAAVAAAAAVYGSSPAVSTAAAAAAAASQCNGGGLSVAPVPLPAPGFIASAGAGLPPLALGGGLHTRVTSIPSILPHPEALLAIRERSHQLYVPLPAAVSRTFGECNNSMIDRRAWLEVEDRKHRYAKNLRLYYKEWDRRGQPGASFWAWLDADGDDRVELEECPRSQLETETVHYCSSPEERRAYEVVFRDGGLLHRRTEAGGEEWGRISTGPDGWIFVLRDGIVYAHEKKTDQVPRFHHSSFFAGECVQAAGLFVANDGRLERLYPHSGHYRPTESHLLSLLLFLEARAVDLAAVQVDVQLVMKVARAHDAAKGGRKRKIDSPYMWTGLHAKFFLEAKRRAWANKLFAQLALHPLTLAKDS